MTPVNNFPISKQLDVILKREDLNQYGSFKDRSLRYWISELVEKGERNFCISSSGNSAISAAGIIHEINKTRDNAKISLQIFISNNINTLKLSRLEKITDSNSNITVIKTDKPKSNCIKYSNESKSYNLRSSVDDLAIVGYKEISKEIQTQVGFDNIDSIFLCCSSGTSTVGIYQGMLDLGLRKFPSIFIIQSSKINPIAREFNKDYTSKDNSVLSAISDRIAHRKSSVVEILNSTKGSGLIIEDDEAKEGREKLLDFGITNASYEMGACLIAPLKAQSQGFIINKPLCIMTGL
jgi:threonine synthase